MNEIQTLRFPLQRDVAVLAGLVGGYLLTGAIPERWDPWITARLASTHKRLSGKRVEALASEMRSRMPDIDRDWPGIARDYYRMRLENFWARARGIHGPSRQWDLEVEGLDHYAAAKAAGRGVILWRMRFCDSPMVNAALHAQGITPVHLSLEGHGSVSGSSLGLRVISPLYTRAEKWYLAERVVIPKDGSLGYMRVLLDRLDANATLSIFADGVGRRPVTARLLGRQVKFPTGAPGLAYRKGAALLPVYGVRLGPHRYRVVIQAPIALPSGTDRMTYISGAIAEFAHRLEAQIRANPADWLWPFWA